MGSVFHQTLLFYSTPLCALWLCRDLDMKWKFGQIKAILGSLPLQCPHINLIHWVLYPEPRNTKLHYRQVLFLIQLSNKQSYLLIRIKWISHFAMKNWWPFWAKYCNGFVSSAQIHEYWSHSKVLSTPFFPAIMSRDHFLKILKFLHLNNSKEQKKSMENVGMIIFLK